MNSEPVVKDQSKICYKLVSQTNGTIRTAKCPKDVSPRSPAEAHRRFGTMYCPQIHGGRQPSSQLKASSCLLLGLLSTLKMEAVHCSETSLNFYRTTQNHISGNTVTVVRTSYILRKVFSKGNNAHEEQGKLLGFL
jgi:hypothetical protein